MAKLESRLHGDFNEILAAIKHEVMDGSLSASLEDCSDFEADNARCAVRVFERYSMLGQNRVSMSVTLFQTGDVIFFSAITAGGSQAVLLKINTFGESAFLDCVEGIVSRYGV